MIGEKGSDLIKASWPQGKEDETLVVPPVEDKTESPLDELANVNNKSNSIKKKKKFSKN